MMDDSERRNQLAGIRDAIQKGAFQPIGMNEAKRMLEKHLSDENAKDDTVTISRIGYEGLCASYDRLHARVAELEARIAEADTQEPVAMVVHHNPPFGAVYKVEWYTKYRDLPDGTKLYAGSAPVPAAPSDGCDEALLDTMRELVAAEEDLAEMAERKDAAYFERNQVVAALAKCFPSIVTQTEIPGWSPDWHGCVYIQLPTGQVSWHFHESQMYLLDGIPTKGAGWDGWDGHGTEEKYRRLNVLPVPAAQASDYWLDGNVIRKGKEYVAEIIGQDPLLLRELLTGKAAAQAEAKVSVGDSRFESWFAQYNPSGKGDKQRARDAYAAGMSDPAEAKAADEVLTELHAILEYVEGEMQSAYNNAYQECCGRSRGGECCGSPEPAWTKEDQAVLAKLSPVQSRLRAMLADKAKGGEK